MKHLQIETIIEKRFEKLNAAFDNVRLQLNEENIRVFRVKVKKLMACLSLIKITTDHLHQVKVSHKMMKFYQLSGPIRTFQMQEMFISKTLNENQISSPNTYLKLISEHILKSTGLLNNQIKGLTPLKKEQVKLLRLLPENMSQKKIQHFILSERERLSNLFSQVFPADKSLHELRKLLKNLLYISPYLDMEINELSPYRLLGTYEELDSFTNLLGSFHDFKTAINCLHGLCQKIEIDEHEKSVLREIETLWIKESADLRKKIYQEMGKIIASASSAYASVD
jgi:CHAD domain-containing protein